MNVACQSPLTCGSCCLWKHGAVSETHCRQWVSVTLTTTTATIHYSCRCDDMKWTTCCYKKPLVMSILATSDSQTPEDNIEPVAMSMVSLVTDCRHYWPHGHCSRWSARKGQGRNDNYSVTRPTRCSSTVTINRSNSSCIVNDMNHSQTASQLLAWGYTYCMNILQTKYNDIDRSNQIERLTIDKNYKFSPQNIEKKFKVNLLRCKFTVGLLG